MSRRIYNLAVQAGFISANDTKDFLEKEVESISKETVSDELDNDVEQKSKTADIERRIDEIVSPMIKEMKDNYVLANEPYFQVRGDSNWYRYFALTRERLMKNEISGEIINELLIDHMFDSIAFTKKYLLINFYITIKMMINLLIN